MSIHQNHNYRIGTDRLENGKIRAKARGRKTNTRTYPEATTHEQAATMLAILIEGDRFAHVDLQSANYDGSKQDWNIFVIIGSEE